MSYHGQEKTGLVHSKRKQNEHYKQGFLFGTCLFAIVCDWRQDSAQGLDTHGNIQQVAGKEEVVVMPK